MSFWVYILRCADGSHYTGHTDDLEKRLAEHHTGQVAGYTATRCPVMLLFSEVCSPVKRPWLLNGGSTRIIHDGSSRNRAVAKRDRRAEPRGREAYLKQYVDRPSGEPACLRTRNRVQACRSGESAIAAEAFMNNAR